MVRLFQILAVYLISALPCAAQNNVIKIGFIERAPYIYALADGTIKGVFGKQLLALFERASADIELNVFYPNDVSDFLKIEGLDGFIVTPIIAGRSDELIFSAKPLITLEFFAYHLPEKGPVSSLADIRNSKVVLPIPLSSMKGDIRAWLEDPQNAITVVNDTAHLDSALPLLRRNQADYIVSYISPESQMTMFSRAMRSSKINSGPLFEVPMYLAIRASHPEAESTISRINSQLKTDE